MPIEAITLLTVDFDYWYLGLNIESRFHCGRCIPRTVRPTVADTRFHRPEITTDDVLNLIQSVTPVYVSECHADIAGLLDRPGKVHVFNVDAHSDIGSNHELDVYCGNWASQLKMDRYQHITKRRELSGIPAPNMVHVCRSSAYLLGSGDAPFVEFVHALEAKCGNTAEVIGFDSAAIKEMLRC